MSGSKPNTMTHHRQQACPSCGYSLTGLAERGHCPECGGLFDITLIDRQLVRAMVSRPESSIAFLPRVIGVAIAFGFFLYGLAQIRIADLGAFTLFFISIVGKNLPLLALILAMVLPYLRYRRARMVLQYVGEAVRLNIPIAPFLDAAAAGESRGVRAQLRKLAARLRVGGSLADSLWSGVPGLAYRDKAMIEAGERSGRLTTVLDHLTRHDDNERRVANFEQSLFWIYPIAVLVTLVTVLSALGVYILPKFEKIFEDFGVELPALTTKVLTGTRHYPQLISIIGTLGLFLFIAFCMKRIFVPWRFDGYPGQAILDRLLWSVPIVGPSMRARSLADTCLAMRLGIEAGLPIPDVLSAVHDTPTNLELRRRLGRWQAKFIETGDLAWSADHAQLPRTLVYVVGTATRTGNLEEAMVFLAEYYAGRFSRLVVVLKQGTLPVLVLGAALLVGAVALSVFLPLVSLIYASNPFVW